MPPIQNRYGQDIDQGQIDWNQAYKGEKADYAQTGRLARSLSNENRAPYHLEWGCSGDQSDYEFDHLQKYENSRPHSFPERLIDVEPDNGIGGSDSDFPYRFSLSLPIDYLVLLGDHYRAEF